MRIYRAILVSFTIALVFLFQPNTASLESSQTKQPGKEPLVILDVQQNAEIVYISPVAFFDDGHFDPPHSKINGDSARKLFTEKYFRAGRDYHLIFGGGDAGTVNVKEGYWQDGSYAYGRLNLVPAVGGTIRGQLHALATNSPGVARLSIWRRSPAPEQRSAAIDLARSLFVQNGTPAPAVSKLEVINLTAIDIDGDNKAELVGTFKTPQPRAEKPPHWLFMIAEVTDQGYQATKFDYQFSPEQTEYPLGKQILIDYCDLDGDGTGEIVTSFTGAEYKEFYLIYQRKNGKWIQVYSGGGSH